jgi:hypothetical protein
VLSGRIRLTPVCSGRLCQACQSSVPAQCGVDPAAGRVPLAGEALGVDLEQHDDAVAGPLGDLRRRDTRAQPRRHRRMPQVVRTSGEWTGGLVLRQCLDPCLSLDPGVRALGGLVLANSSEEQAIGRRAERGEMIRQKRCRLGRARN